eukprot:gene13840-15286_t
MLHRPDSMENLLESDEEEEGEEKSGIRYFKYALNLMNKRRMLLKGNIRGIAYVLNKRVLYYRAIFSSKTKKALEDHSFGYFPNDRRNRNKAQGQIQESSVIKLPSTFATALLTTGIVIQTSLRWKYKEDGDGPNSYMFFFGAGVCLIPGVYHVVYIYRAAKGDKGYKMEDVTMFHE